MTESLATDEKKSTDIPLVVHLRKLASRQERGALADLRNGLRRKPGYAMEMWQHLGDHIDSRPSNRKDRAVFLTSALFAYYWDAQSNVADLGESMLRLSRETESKSIASRFVALLDADAENLHYYLKQVIGLLKAKQIAVNWNELYTAIKHWESDDKWVQRKWARSFWADDDDDPSPDQNNHDNQNEEEGED